MLYDKVCGIRAGFEPNCYDECPLNIGKHKSISYEVLLSGKTGNISICHEGKMIRDLTSSTLQQKLEELLTKD